MRFVEIFKIKLIFNEKRTHYIKEKTVRDNAIALLVPLRGWLKPPAYSRLACRL